MTTSSSQSHTTKIDFSEFKKDFKGDIFQPQDERYNKRLERFYSQLTVETTGKPKYIVGPKDSKDVALAIRFATRSQEIDRKEAFAIISGGHWVGQNCCEGVLIDLNL